jgi:hypothetical protein
MAEYNKQLLDCFFNLTDTDVSITVSNNIIQIQAIKRINRCFKRWDIVGRPNSKFNLCRTTTHPLQLNSILRYPRQPHQPD